MNTDRDREITARVGVSYMLPEDKVLVADRLEEVRVRIKGPWRQLRRFDEREVDRVNLDLRRAPAGDIAITNDMIHLPSGLTIENVEPRTVHVAWDRRVEKVVEVTPNVTGRPQHGYVMTDAQPPQNQKTIKVRGAEGALGALDSVRTRDIPLDGRAETFTVESEVLPPDGVELLGPAQVAVTVTIQPELVKRDLPSVPVVMRGDGVDAAKWAVSPASVDIELTGALLEIEAAKATLAAVVKVSAADTKDTKPHEVDVTIEGVPKSIGVKVSPERVRISPVKPAPPTSPSPPTP